MIKVTKLNDEEYFINPHQIEYMQETPDLTITMLSGKRLVVKEKYPVVFERIIEYRKQIGAFKNEE